MNAPHIIHLLELHLQVSFFTLHPLLCQAAQKHAVWMAENNHLSHTGKGGSSHGQRIAATGYQAGATAENIARGYSSPESVFRGWMNSRGHRRNIERGYNHLGLGESDNYWCAVFADPVNDDMVIMYSDKEQVL